MIAFSRKVLDYSPKEIVNDVIIETDNNTTSNEALASKDIITEESAKVVDRLIEHIKIIDEYKDRLDTIEYLINNAEALIKNELSYETTDSDILGAIKAYGGNGSYVTFSMFKRALLDIIEVYNNMVVSQLAGLEI